MKNVASLISKSALIAAIVGASIFPSIPASAAAPEHAKAACTVRNAQARLLAINQPSLPTIAALQDLSGSAVVSIDLDSDGKAHNPVIVTSTGYPVLDKAARKAAVEQTFAPEIRECGNVAGTYAVVIDFAK